MIWCETKRYCHNKSIASCLVNIVEKCHKNHHLQYSDRRIRFICMFCNGNLSNNNTHENIHTHPNNCLKHNLSIWQIIYEIKTNWYEIVSVVLLWCFLWFFSMCTEFFSQNCCEHVFKRMRSSRKIPKINSKIWKHLFYILC